MRLPSLTSVSARHLPLIFGGALLVVIAIASAASILMLRQQAVSEWSNHLENLALILGEHAEETMTSADLILTSLGDVDGEKGVLVKGNLGARFDGILHIVQLREK